MKLKSLSDSLTVLQAHLKAVKALAQTKAFKRACK